MSASDAEGEAFLQKWKDAKSWRDLLRLNARYINSTDPLTPYAATPASYAPDLKTSLLRLQEYGFLVRFAHLAHDSGPVNNRDSGLWEHTSSRAVLHCILPTKSAVPIPKIKTLVQEMIVDDMKIEITVLEDYKNYPGTSDLGIGYRENYAQPLAADEVLSSRPLELFRSTVGLLANPSANTGSITGKTYGKCKEAATKAELEAKYFKRAPDMSLPNMAVDDVRQGSANCRAFEMRLEAAVSARCIETVRAEKRYGSGLDLIGYIEKTCAEAELYPVFKRK